MPLDDPRSVFAPDDVSVTSVLGNPSARSAIAVAARSRRCLSTPRSVFAPDDVCPTSAVNAAGQPSVDCVDNHEFDVDDVDDKAG